VPKTQNPVTKHPFLSFTSANSKTEGYVEGVMRNLKQEDFPGRKYLRADVFVSENYERIRRRIIDYSDRLDSCKREKPKRSYKRKKKDADNPIPVSSEEYSEDLQEHDYHNAEETWGKRDPETPKTNPRLGQYQQSPKIPLSQDPDLKEKSIKKKRRRGYQDKVTVTDTDCVKSNKKARKITTPISSKIASDKEKKCSMTNASKCRKNNKNPNKNGKQRLSNAEHRANRKRLTEWLCNQDSNDLADKANKLRQERATKRKRVNSSETDSKDKKFMKFENNLHTSGSNINFVGLQNRKNDCWLNSLVQCMNNLPIKNCLLDNIKESSESPLTTALTSVLSKIDSLGNHGSFYPKELHDAFQCELQYAPGEQCDIHESFTSLCCPRSGMNEEIASHFQVGVQFRKTCLECSGHEDGPPETFTSLPLSVLDDIPQVEDSIENILYENISIICRVCQVAKMHTRRGKFIFLPDTLALLFKRFSFIDTLEHKKHSKVDLQREIVVMGNTPSYYVLKACALHHGEHIHNGHYTVLIFDDEKVIEVDDQRAYDRTENWKSHADTTVYLAFYLKMNSSVPGSVATGNKKPDVFTKHGINRNKNNCKIRQGCEKQENNGKRYPNEGEIYWNVETRDYLLCNANEFGYELKGRDFKTLEFPVIDNSYTLDTPGWLNDNIVDAYISLLVEAAGYKSTGVYALNCFFMKKLRGALLKNQSEKNWYEMISKFHKQIEFEQLDYIVVPINTNNGQHWTVLFIDIWMGRIYFYDPMLPGNRNETDVKLIKFYFEQFFKCNSYDVQILEKGFVRDFDVIWEDQFACQKDYASCGVYVLMYISHKLRLLNRDPLHDNISDIRKEFVEERSQGRKFVPTGKPVLGDSDKLGKKCSTASLYKQRLGGKVVLHCHSSGEFKSTFLWTLEGVAVSSDETYTFILSKDKVGEYACYVTYDDGLVLKSSCIVECATKTTEKILDKTEILNSLKVAIEWNLKKKSHDYTCCVIDCMWTSYFSYPFKCIPEKYQAEN
jgi:ubiquitin C-terminal hydrolase